MRFSLFSILVCLFTHIWCFAQLPGRQTNRPRIVPSDEAGHRAHVELLRSYLAVLDAEIASREKFMVDLPTIITPDRTPWYYQRLDQLWEERQREVKWLKELEWGLQQREQKPSRLTDAEVAARLEKLREELWPTRQVAPMPREAKPKP